jgi:hypothetical protein
VDCSKHIRIPFVSLVLELLICIDFVAFCLENPAEGFWVHVVDVVFIELEGIAVVFKHLIIVYL